MHDFRIGIAGIPVAVRCQFQENQEFFRDYFTEQEPVLTVEPGTADLQRVKEKFERLDAASDIQVSHRSDSFLENNAIHAILAEKLVREGVLLMHGSALCMDGAAYIFTAKSGIGKSTHARLWQEAFGDRVWMINDDKPMLRFTGTEVRVCGTPWNGKHHLSRNASAPLKAIVELERSETNRIEPMKKADAFSLLMRQCVISRDPVTMMQIMELEKRLVSAADFFKLGCNTEPDAAVAAYEGMV